MKTAHRTLTALAITTSAAACGGDDTQPATTTTATTGATSAVTSASGPGGTGGGSASSSTGAGAGGTGGSSPVPTVPFVYVGADDDTITTYVLDRATGALTFAGTAPAGSNPSFLATDPQHRFLFAVDESSSEVEAFAIDSTTGLLTSVGSKKSSEGNGPAYVSVDKSGDWALVANYGGGTVAVLPIGADGALGDAVDVESPGTNPHLIRTDASNAFAFVPNKGSDTVSQFLFDAQTGDLTANTPPSVATAAGAGPRHLEFHPTLPVVYVIDELDDTVVTYAFDDAAGTLAAGATLTTLPVGGDGPGNSCADLHISADGRFLYGSNRGDDSIVIYAVDEATGALTLVGHQATGGSWPRNFGIDPAGGILLVANQHTNDVVTFRIDQGTGLLTELETTSTNGAPAWVGVVTQAEP